MVQLSGSETATQWRLATPPYLQDFLLSKWEIFLQCKVHMTLQLIWPIKPRNLGPQLERTPVFVVNSCPSSNQEKNKTHKVSLATVTV